MSTEIVSVETTEEATMNHNIFDEYLTDDAAAKVVFNSLLKKIPYFAKDQWKAIYEKLNENSLKDLNVDKCYKVGCVKLLKGYAKKYNWNFAKENNKLFVYDKAYWIKVDEDLIKIFLKEAAFKMGIPEGLATEVKFVNYVHEQLLLDGFYEKMVQSNVTYLNLQNGTLRISNTGVTLEEFNPKHFLTHQLDFEYNKDVQNEQWLTFLDMVLPDKDLQKTLQQSLGYLFVRDLKLEKAIFLYGTGSNGKSVIFEVIKGILDSDMMTNYSLAHLTNKLGYQVADLNNKLINYASDISMKHVDPAIFKQLVSGEPIGTRQIREKAFTMKNYAKLIFNVNKLDDADVESTHGFYRRMVFIPFDVTITKEQQDKKLHKKLLENKTGIMNWIIEGIEEVVKNEEIFLAQKCENFIDNFKKESNPVILFLDHTRLVPTNVEDNEVMNFQTVYDMYRDFCKEQGEKPVAQRNLNADIKRLGFERTRRKHGYVWHATIKKLNKTSGKEFDEFMDMF